jgi:hypothetical protein
VEQARKDLGPEGHCSWALLRGWEFRDSQVGGKSEAGTNYMTGGGLHPRREDRKQILNQDKQEG